MRYWGGYFLCLFMNEEQYLKLKFWYRNRLFPDLEKPRSYSEKILWLVLNYRQPLLRTLVDKVRVRELVAARCGEKYLSSIYGVWEKAEDIDFRILPEKFVLKTNHGSKWNYFCPDKSSLNPKMARRHIKRWLGRDYYRFTKEWVYKGIQPLAFAEEYLEGTAETPLYEYQFRCFHGEPHSVIISHDRYGDHRVEQYDTNWKPLEIKTRSRRMESVLEKPAVFGEMMEMARELSAGLPIARVDMYLSGNRIVFGEVTVFPGGGTAPFLDKAYEKKLSGLLNLQALEKVI